MELLLKSQRGKAPTETKWKRDHEKVIVKFILNETDTFLLSNRDIQSLRIITYTNILHVKSDSLYSPFQVSSSFLSIQIALKIK